MGLLNNMFKNKAKKNSRQVYATKQNIFTMASELPVEGNWLSDEEISKIEEDSTVSSAQSIRKSATLKKEIIIQTEDEKIKEVLLSVFSFEFMQQALDCPLQGLSVFELNWREVDNFLVPIMIERNYRDFSLQSGMLIYLPNQETVAPHKAVYSIYKPKFDKPLGRPLYHTLFWLRKFKSGSISFWLDYMEKFGTPWTIGQTNSGDKDDMARNLYAMLGGDVAVIEEDDKVEIVTPSSNGNFKELSIYCDDQIREVLLGGNLTGEVKGASLAAAKVHDDIREDIAMIDQQLLQNLMNQVLLAFKEINNITTDVNILLKDHDSPNYALAERDVRVHTMSGGKFSFTREYLEKTYHVELEENSTRTAIPNKLIPFSTTKPTDHIEVEQNRVDTKEIEENILTQVEEMFDQAESFEDALHIIHEAFPTYNTDEIEQMIEKLYANSTIYGRAKVEDEHKSEV